MKCHYEGCDVLSGRCMGTKEVDPCVGYDNCEMFKPEYKSNADWLRSMNDRELAEWLCNHFDCSVCRLYLDGCYSYRTPNTLLKWLRKECEE